MYELIESLELILNNNFTYSVIFILGMFHALEPGHGKTLILAYLSGGSLRFSGSLKIISGLIITHFLLFSLIAFLIKAGGDKFPILVYIGPLLIIFLGVYLLIRSLKETRHENEEECNDPMHFHFNDTKYASPFITGLVAGSTPCPSAIAVLLIAANKFQNDFITLYSSIFIYVLGIALTLIGIMTLFLMFKDRFVNQLNSVNKKFNTNIVAAILIITVGILYFMFSYLGIEHQH